MEHNYKFAFFKDKAGKTTISARSTYAGKTVKGYAKCDPRDEYDEEKGKELASARCNAKIAKQRTLRAEKKVAEAKYELEKAQKHLEKMESYFADSVVKLNYASEHVKDVLDKI